jgi:methylenetetrahydrofolate reductase (NADPH)
LLAIYHRLRTEGRLASGGEMDGKGGKAKPFLLLGCAGHPTADPLPAQVLRLLKKAHAGADFVQTQCLFDLERFRQFMARAHDEGVTERLSILAGIMPVRTPRAFEMLRRIPGIHVPEDLVRRLSEAADKEAEGLSIARELLEGIRGVPGVAGVHLMAPSWEAAIPALLEHSSGLSAQGPGQRQTAAVAQSGEPSPFTQSPEPRAQSRSEATC